MSNRVSSIIDPSNGKPFVHTNGQPRPQLIEAMLANVLPRRARLGYDASRDTAEYQRHWQHTDALDADATNSREVRHKLIHRSRYESGSDGYYDGILDTHSNMVVGIGPTLRMLTSTRNFNQLVEREFYKWAQQIQLRRKLWCMNHAYNQDGDGMGLMLTNPVFRGVQLDLVLMEAEQCQTPLLPFAESGYIDGIKFDENDNIQWYDVLPSHPGSTNNYLISQKPIRVSPQDMLHWFKLKRPGSHRGVPTLTSTLNLGASSRRWREAVLAAAESAADFNILLQTAFPPDAVDPVSPMSTLAIEKRMMTALPAGWGATQMKGEFPTATHSDYNRGQISELGRPLSQPYNVAACDSSTYSFASGKLDTLAYRAAIDVERQDCNDLVLDPLFNAWFREWSLTKFGEFRNAAPIHQWDWPVHPVIDAVEEANATDTQLKNGTITLRQVYSDKGQDLEDQLSVMAEDWFGEASEENIAKARQIELLRTLPSHVVDHVAAIIGLDPLEQPATELTGAKA